MKNVRINGKDYEILLFVFDKDGLLFESRQFWIELAQARIKALDQNYPEVPSAVVDGWLEFVGVSYQTEKGQRIVTEVDPLGILAIAPVPEEIISAAAYFMEHLKCGWISARKMAVNIFEMGDRLFNLKHALKPRAGFPDIFHRLRKAQIPYGIATSDTANRAKKSVDLFDDSKWMSFTVTVDDVEQGKPEPDMLYLIQKELQIPMGKIAMVGDSLVDVQMAKEAGAIGIGIPEQEEMEEKMLGIATEIVHSLEEISMKKGADIYE